MGRKPKEESSQKASTKTKSKKAPKFDVSVHEIVPKHTKISEKEKKSVLERYDISVEQLPSIFISDPAIRDLDLEENDVIKIERKSPTAKVTYYYRRVIK